MAQFNILAFSGGVGGAKLVRGLAACLPSSQLNVVVNTADDFQHFGLYIAPDIDTVCYALANKSDPIKGWGVHNETWRVLETLRSLGAEDWFQLGDTDLATHLYRTQLLGSGYSLSESCGMLARALGVDQNIIPMSDDAVRTILKVRHTDGTIEELSFQDYFVRLACAPEVLKVYFSGIDKAQPQAKMMHWLNAPSLTTKATLPIIDAIILTPSNPFLSIDPILALKGVRQTLRMYKAPIVAVSPIVGGKALKGPLAEIMLARGDNPSAKVVAEYYQDFLDGFVLDTIDSSCAGDINMPVKVCNTVMQNDDDKKQLALQILDFCFELASH